MIKPTHHTVKRALLVSLASAVLTLSACGDETSNPKVSSTSAPAASVFQVKHVDAKGAHALLSTDPEAVILDVRTPKEIEGGYIEGAVFANFYDEGFTQQLTKLDRSAPYIVHCRSGGRSTKALSTLEELGFTNVTHMDGGLQSWEREKLPLTKSE